MQFAGSLYASRLAHARAFAVCPKDNDRVRKSMGVRNAFLAMNYVDRCLEAAPVRFGCMPLLRLRYHTTRALDHRLPLKSFSC